MEQHIEAAKLMVSVREETSMNDVVKYPYQVAVDFINKHGARVNPLSAGCSPYKILKALSVAKGARMNGAKSQVVRLNGMTEKQLNKKVREVLSLFCDKGIFVLPKEFNVRKNDVNRLPVEPSMPLKSAPNRKRNKSRDSIRNPKELAAVLAKKHKEGSITLSNRVLISVATVLDKAATDGQIRVMAKEASLHGLKLEFKHKCLNV